MLEFPRPESTGGVAELEWPEEVACLLEVGSDGHDLVYEIFHADDAEFAEIFLNDGVVGEWDALLGDFAVSTLVDEVADGLDARIAVGNVGFDDFKHLGGGFGQFDKDTIVYL